MRRNVAFGAAGLALAVAYWFAADALPTSLLADNVGAGGVPKGIAVALALFSIAAAFSRIPPGDAHANPLKALGIAALGFAYVAVAPLIGYFISVALLAGAAALYYGAPRRAGVAVFALGTAAILWATFGRMLGIPLP